MNLRTKLNIFMGAPSLMGAVGLDVYPLSQILTEIGNDVILRVEFLINYISHRGVTDETINAMADIDHYEFIKGFSNTLEFMSFRKKYCKILETVILSVFNTSDSRIDRMLAALLSSELQSHNNEATLNIIYRNEIDPGVMINRLDNIYTRTLEEKELHAVILLFSDYIDVMEDSEIEEMLPHIPLCYRLYDISGKTDNFSSITQVKSDLTYNLANRLINSVNIPLIRSLFVPGDSILAEVKGILSSEIKSYVDTNILVAKDDYLIRLGDGVEVVLKHIFPDQRIDTSRLAQTIFDVNKMNHNVFTLPMEVLLHIQIELNYNVLFNTADFETYTASFTESPKPDFKFELPRPDDNINLYVMDAVDSLGDSQLDRLTKYYMIREYAISTMVHTFNDSEHMILGDIVNWIFKV